MMMKRMGAWMLLALLTLVGEWHGRCYGCLEEERIVPDGVSCFSFLSPQHYDNN